MPELKPAWQVQVDILNGEDTAIQEFLGNYYGDKPESHIPIITIEVQRSIIPPDGREPLIQALINTVKRNGYLNSLVTEPAAAALKHLDASDQVKAALQGELEDRERRALEDLIEEMEQEEEEQETEE